MPNHIAIAEIPTETEQATIPPTATINVAATQTRQAELLPTDTPTGTATGTLLRTNFQPSS